MGLQEGFRLLLRQAVAGTGRVEEFDLRGGNGGLRVLALEINLAVLGVALNVLSEHIRDAAERQGGGDQGAFLSHLDRAVGTVIGGLGAGAALPCVAGAVGGGDDVFLAVIDLDEVAADEEIEEAVLDVLQLAFQRVALAKTVSHGHLLRAGLEEGGVFRHGVSILLADHAEVDAAFQDGGRSVWGADGVIAGAGDGGHRQGGGVVLVHGEFIHVRFFLSVALWIARQAYNRSKLHGISRSS